MRIPDEAIEAAAEAMNSTVPNTDGVLWEFDVVIDQRTGMTQPHPVTLKDAARVALNAALPAIREAIAQEIEAHNFGFDSGADCGYAAELVRGGTA